MAFVLHSGVLCENVDSYEDAPALAAKWRTISLILATALKGL